MAVLGVTLLRELAVREKPDDAVAGDEEEEIDKDKKI